MSSAEVWGQDAKLDIKASKMNDQKIIDSIPYKSIHPDENALRIETSSFQKKLELMGYLGAELLELIKTDSLYTAIYDPGIRISYIELRYDIDPSLGLQQAELTKLLKFSPSEELIKSFKELPEYLQDIADELESTGRSFVEVRLSTIEIEKGMARAKLQIVNSKTRTIDKVIIRGYPDFPKNFIAHELGLKKGSSFNKSKLEQASKALTRIPFANQVKDPEVLFTKDSTIIYLYLKKSKSNRFDGILGFASKEEGSGLEFNGYLDLAVNNIFNSGETIALYWKNNGNDRQRFFLQAETPFLFNSPISPLFNFELYRQDSTFNNVTAKIDLNYLISLKSSAALAFRTESSNDLSNSGNSTISSYSNWFLGASYRLENPTADPVFLFNYQLVAQGLFGSRKAEDNSSSSQTRFTLTANYLWPIDNRNYIFIQNESGILNSPDYFENELFRIGGINNLRGVNEESLLVSAYTIFNLEYRFKPSPGSYFYTISDFAYIENQVVGENTNVISLGLGYAFKTKAGILNLSYANGKFENTPFSFDNSKVHIKIITYF